PEEPLELSESRMHFRQARTAEIKKDIWIPARNFCSPFVFRIAAVGAEYCDLRKAPGDLLEINWTHPARSDVFRLVKLPSQHNASMEQDDPAILVGQLIHRKIRWIVVWLPYKLQFAQAAVADRVQLLQLLDYIRSIQVHRCEGNNLIGMLPRRVDNRLPMSKWSKHTSSEIEPVGYR